MSEGKRIKKIMKYEKRHNVLLERSPSLFVNYWGREIVNVNGLSGYYRELEYESQQIAHHRFMYFLENKIFYPTPFNTK